MSTSREAELKSQVAQLTSELEQEKSKSKQLHYDKVREVKSTKDKEKDLARQQQEELKAKLEKDKAQELKSLQESLSKEFKQQLREAQKKHEEQMNTAESKWKKEKSELRSKVRRELQEQIEHDVNSRHATEQKKMARELFKLNSQLQAEEEKVARLTAAKKNKEELLQQKEEEHRVELEKTGRSARKTSKQHVEEMDGFRRQLLNKEKELSQLAEKLSRTTADKDKIEEELKRLKQAESWVRRSSSPTSPSLSPSASVEELTAVAKQVTKRERDMVIKNSELSFRVRTLEDGISELRKENSELKKKLKESQSQLTPIKDHNNKLNLRINDLNSSLRSREKKVSSLSQEIVELKTAKQHLEEEYTHQRKTLQQQMTKGSSYRAELQRLNDRNKTVVDTNARLLTKVDKLETEKSQLEDRLRNLTMASPTPLSPSPFSPTPHQDDDVFSLSSSSSSVQLLEQMSQMEFDKEESEAKLQELNDKYKEMKSEYSSLRGKYKSVRKVCEETQLKLQELQISYREQVSSSEKERLRLEGELNLVRRTAHITTPYDQDRNDVTVVSLQSKLDEHQREIDELQKFIIEQDTIWVRQEKVWEAEKKELVSKIENNMTVIGDSRLRNSSLQEGTNPELAEEMDPAADELTALQEANDKLVEDLNTVTDEISTLQEANDKLVEELETATNKITTLHEANTKLSQRLAEETSHASTLREEKSQVSEELDRVKILLKDKEEECSVLSDKVAHLDAQITAATEEINSLRENCADGVDMLNSESELAPPEPPTSLPPSAVDEEDFSHPSSSLPLDSEDNSLGHPPATLSTAQQLTGLVEKYKEELQQKEEENNELRESLSLAQANITQMRGLLENLQETLRAQTQEHQNLFTDKDEQIKHLSDQLSQANSKSTRLRRAMSVGVNQQMAQEIGHKVNDAIKKLSSAVQSPSSSNSEVISELILLEAAVNELLHTLFPGTFDSVVSVDPNLNSEPNMTSGLSLKSESDTIEKYTHDDLPDHSFVSSHSSSPDVSPPHHSPPHTPTPPHVQQSPPHTLTSLHSPPPQSNISHNTLLDLEKTEHTQIAPTPLIHTKDESLNVLTQSWGDGFNLSLVSPAPVHSPLHRMATKDSFRLPTHLDELEAVVSSGRKPTVLKSSFIPPSSETRNEFLDRQMRVFVAVMDYDPRSLCVTGKPNDELHFSTGAVLAVRGSMDDEGYYLASFEGKTGRVPANFIQEVDVVDPVMKNRLYNQTLSRPLTPDSYALSSHHTLLTTPNSSGLMQSFVRGQQKSLKAGCPKPPTHFHVDKVLGNSVLLIRWQPPTMDASDSNYSNGCLVTGYQLYVNGETKTLVSGATQNKATLVGLNLSQPITLGISTSGSEGKSSEVISLHQPARPMSTVSSPSPEPEVYKLFIALYDYDPVKSSPCEHPEFELAFSEGDLIKVYGQEMDDGLIVGELNGQRGLVPASFISEVKKSNVKKQTADSAPSPAQSPAPADSQLPVTAKVMIASFDYVPERDSPNPNPELELSFMRGDEITVFGKMHGDGYYSGKLKDKHGLVPSNYLKEPPSTSPIHNSDDQVATPTEQPTAMVKLRKKAPTKDKVKMSNGITQSEKTSVEQNGVKTKHKKTSSERITKESISPVETGPQTKRKRHGFRWSKSSSNKNLPTVLPKK